MNLKNKVAIVTGAGQGIGKGIAVALAKAGVKVLVADLDRKNSNQTAEEINKAGGEAIAVKCDVSKKSDAEKMVKAAAKKFGRVDILVNNAGIFPFTPFLKMKEKDWDKVLDVNLKSVFLCSQAVLAAMPEGGRIISISSIASLVGFEGLTHYCASKGGINGLARALALELAPKKITVNAIAPGYIKTPGASKGLTEEAEKQTLAAIPLARAGRPEDIASAVLFLASEGAGYITGQILVVDGGWTLR